MKKFGWEEDYFQGKRTKWMILKPKIWALFDEPYSSKSAKVSLSLCPLPLCYPVTLSFCFSVPISSSGDSRCLRRLHLLLHPLLLSQNPPKLPDSRSRVQKHYLQGSKRVWSHQTSHGAAFHLWPSICSIFCQRMGNFQIELVCNVWFTIELLLRFAFCPSHLGFIKSPLNVIDMVSFYHFGIDREKAGCHSVILRRRYLH